MVLVPMSMDAMLMVQSSEIVVGTRRAVPLLIYKLFLRKPGTPI